MAGFSSLVVAAGGVVLALCYFFVRLVQQRRSMKGLPMPPHSFFWGHLKLFGEVFQMFPPGTHAMFTYTYIKLKYDLPDIFYIDLWPLEKPQTVFTAPEACAQASTVKAFPQHPGVEAFLSHPIGPNFIECTNGPLWKDLHQAIAPSLTATSIKTMMGNISREALTFHETLSALSKSRQPLNFEEHLGSVLVGTIGRLVIGDKLDVGSTRDDLFEHVRGINSITIADRMTWNPFRWFKSWLVIRSHKARLRDILVRLIRQRFTELQAEKEMPSKKRDAKSIMDRFLFERVSNGGVVDQAFMEVVLDNIIGVIMGGFGTTTDTLAYIHMIISIHPEVKAKLREEHDRIFGPDLSETVDILRRAPSKSNELEYTNAVIKETLRLFPIGFSIRQAPPDVSHITHNGEAFPLRGMLFLANHAMHYMESYFPSPNTFDPGRFIRGDVSRNAYRPFERGLRSCIGQELAMEQMRVVLLLTVRWFDLELDVTTSEKPLAFFTDWDTKIGAHAFQHQRIAAGPAPGLRMKVSMRGEPATAS